jgi:hypothetical protein
MFDTMLCSGWACTDCLMLLANGETSPEWTQEETDAYVARVEERNPAGSITLGMVREEHECADDDGQTENDRGGECECEQQSFSWSPCDVCGSNLGGSRHAVTFWE